MPELDWSRCQLCGSKEDLGSTCNCADLDNDIVLCRECGDDCRRIRKMVSKWGIRLFLIHAGAIAGRVIEVESLER